jgi:hypothetical protein
MSAGAAGSEYAAGGTARLLESSLVVATELWATAAEAVSNTNIASPGAVIGRQLAFFQDEFQL